MAKDSVIAAAQEKYDSLTAALFPSSTRPEPWFDEAPLYSSGQLRPPLVVLKQPSPSGVVYDEKSNAVERTRVVFEIYADTKAQVDQIAKAIQWNGQNPDQRAGFDLGTLSMNAPWYHMGMRRVGNESFVAGVGDSGQRVHGGRLTYDVETGVRGAG